MGGIAFNTPKYLSIRCSIAALQHCRIIEAFLAPMLHLSPFVKTMQGLQPNTPRLGARDATKVQVMCLRGPSGDSME